VKKKSPSQQKATDRWLRQQKNTVAEVAHIVKQNNKDHNYQTDKRK
jgi:hypothetical protein